MKGKTLAFLIGGVIAILIVLGVTAVFEKKPEIPKQATLADTIILRPTQFWATDKPDPADPSSSFYQIYFDIVNFSEKDITITVDEFFFTAPDRKFHVTTSIKDLKIPAGEKINKPVTFVLNPNYHMPLIANEGFYCLFKYSYRHTEPAHSTLYAGNQVIYFYKNEKFEFVYKKGV